MSDLSLLEQEYLKATQEINEQLKLATEALIKAQQIANQHHTCVANFGDRMNDRLYDESQGEKSLNVDLTFERNFTDALYKAGWSSSSC